MTPRTSTKKTDCSTKALKTHLPTKCWILKLLDGEIGKCCFTVSGVRKVTDDQEAIEQPRSAGARKRPRAIYSRWRKRVRPKENKANVALYRIPKRSARVIYTPCSVLTEWKSLERAKPFVMLSWRVVTEHFSKCTNWFWLLVVHTFKQCLPMKWENRGKKKSRWP